MDNNTRGQKSLSDIVQKGLKFAKSGSKYMIASPGLNVTVSCTSSTCGIFSTHQIGYRKPVQLFPSTTWTCLSCDQEARTTRLCIYKCAINLQSVPALHSEKDTKFTTSDVAAKREAKKREEPEPELSFDRVLLDELAGWCTARGIEQCVWEASEPLYEDALAKELEKDAVEQEQVAKDVAKLESEVKLAKTETVKDKVALDVVESESEKCASAMEETIEKVSSGEISAEQAKAQVQKAHHATKETLAKVAGLKGKFAMKEKKMMTKKEEAQKKLTLLQKMKEKSAAEYERFRSTYAQKWQQMLEAQGDKWKHKFNEVMHELKRTRALDGTESEAESKAREQLQHLDRLLEEAKKSFSSFDREIEELQVLVEKAGEQEELAEGQLESIRELLEALSE